MKLFSVHLDEVGYYLVRANNRTEALDKLKEELDEEFDTEEACVEEIDLNDSVIYIGE